MQGRQLRVGLLVDGPILPAWQRRAVEEIRATECAVLVLVAVDEPAARGRIPLRSLPLEAFRWLDRRVLGRHRQDAFRPVDVSRLLADVSEVRVRRDRAAPERLAAASLETLRAASLDVLLHLGTRPLRGAALDVPALGVWTDRSLELARRGFEPFLAEVLAGAVAWESALEVVGEDGPRRVLYRSFSSFEASPRPRGRPVSLIRGAGSIAWKSASYPARALRGFASGAAKESAVPVEAPAPRAAGLGVAARLCASVALRLVQRALDRRFDRRWFVSLRTAPDAPFVDLPETPDRFAADPMLAEHGGRCFLFYEEAPFDGKGTIHCAALDGSGRPIESRLVLEEEWHLSYPFVFEYDDAWYMIPESSARKTVELYRAVEFPWRFERVAVLLEGIAAADATVWRESGLLWMFVNVTLPGAAPNEELWLYHAPSPEGPWTPHPGNPIVSDVRCARPAGPLYVEDGMLIRPAQDCSRHYGSAIWLQRVDHLSETDYRESPLRRIEPGWHSESESTHTLSRAGSFEVRDGLRRVRKGSAARTPAA